MLRLLLRGVPGGGSAKGQRAFLIALDRGAGTESGANRPATGAIGQPDNLVSTEMIGCGAFVRAFPRLSVPKNTLGFGHRHSRDHSGRLSATLSEALSGHSGSLSETLSRTPHRETWAGSGCPLPACPAPVCFVCTRGSLDLRPRPERVKRRPAHRTTVENCLAF